MSFMTVTKEDVAAIKESSGGNYLTETGLYLVKIVRCSFKTSDKGFRSVDFTFDYNGNEKTIYQLGLYNKDGSENFMMPVFKQLLTICGITELKDPVKQNVGVKTQEGIKPVEMQLFEQFAGKELQVALVKTWNKYQGEIRGKLQVNKFYSKDGLTGKEIAAGVTSGAQLDKDMEYLKDRYSKGNQDAVTEQEVLAFLGKQVKQVDESTDENPFV